MSKSNIISGVEFLRQTLAGIPLTTDVATLSKIDDLTCTAANRIRELEARVEPLQPFKEKILALEAEVELLKIQNKWLMDAAGVQDAEDARTLAYWKQRATTAEAEVARKEQSDE